MRREIFEGLLSNDIIGFHTRSYCNNFLQCCRELMDLRTDFQRGAVISPGRARDVGAALSARDRPRGLRGGRARARRVAEHEPEILRRRREHLILRVDRADLSKNVLRGFTAFDIFLEQHPEFREEVTFIAHLQPSRQDVPEYVEYLEKIEALVAVINHRHGTTDWMPIDLRLRDDFDEAVALYKHFDLLLVNAMWDGMNLVAKEGPLVNTRDGMMILSENTGAHEELGACALSVNPFDVQEQADAMYQALTATPEERAAPHAAPARTSSSRARRPTGSTTSSPTSRRSAAARQRRPACLRSARPAGSRRSESRAELRRRRRTRAGGVHGRRSGGRRERRAVPAARACGAPRRLGGAPACAAVADAGRPARTGGRAATARVTPAPAGAATTPTSGGSARPARRPSAVAHTTSAAPATATKREARDIAPPDALGERAAFHVAVRAWAATVTATRRNTRDPLL